MRQVRHVFASTLEYAKWKLAYPEVDHRKWVEVNSGMVYVMY
jgi:hypothetical protein